MTWARLRLRLPDDTWLADLTREFPDASVELLAGLPGEEASFALLSVVAEDVGTIREALEAHPGVERATTIQETDGELTVQVETSQPTLMRAAKRSGMPVELPIAVSDGEATLDVVGAHDSVAELGRQLEEVGIRFEVEVVGPHRHADQVLTDTQQELICAAVEQGYYDTPRECTLTELAEHVGIAKSTCSETLQRAEETLIKRFIDEIPHVDPQRREVVA